MILKDSFVLAAPLEKVWALCQDIPQISGCMPGAAEVREIKPDVYQGKLKAKVGVVKAAFEGQATVTERVTLEKLSASFKAVDRALASSVTGTFTAQLAPVAGGTNIEYQMDMVMRGRLATLGFTVVQQTAKKMTTEFVKCFTERVLKTG